MSAQGSQPDAALLLQLAIAQLEADAYPRLSGPERYRTRVALNALRIVRRELTLGPGFAREEAAELQAWLGPQADAGTLASAIEDGSVDLDDPRLRPFLRRSLERALRINNPRWLPDGPHEDTP